MDKQTLQESETAELKKSLAELKQGLISMVAILNKHKAGTLWFGVRNDGAVVGLSINEKTLRDLSQAIAAHIEPKIFPEISEITIDDKTCIKIAFAGDDVPYFAYGRAYMRVADEDRQLSVKQLKNLIAAQSRESLRWDNQPGKFTLTDLDLEKIKRFVDLAKLVWDTPQNALAKLGLTQNGQLLNPARLFFGNQPLQLRCAVFLSTESSTIVDRHDFNGDILELIEEAQKYILKNIHIGMRVEGLRRMDVPEIAVEALREAVINAFCHRDYYDPDYVQVAIFKDRVEIRNPGTLFGNLTIADLRKGNVSQRRNPLIADLFRRIEMVEAWGRGMPLILKYAPDVDFREIGNLFIVSFPRPSFFELESEGGTATQETTQETTQEKIIAALKTEPTLTRKLLAQQMGISEDGVKYHLNKLRAAGRIRHVGPNRGGRWEVAKAGTEK
ncbi:Divergent AAA domain protein [Desulfosarcina cetonica]|uniref:ATP-binding protein n=1 Tax=Desulfosarcina cetonica TaxID=90730 RepID=UPI0006D08BEB|nr:ATP-binding protein [Desulfosarcina cetonica]VTR68775.1 Divergent AAA domain protein [Desulfosarcina cetonica]